MCDEWMPAVTLSLTAEQYQQLPRNAAYQYDYLHGTAYLTPRAKHFHGVLDFAGWQALDPEELSPDVRIRPMVPQDQVMLPELLAAAFERAPPFGGLAGEQRLSAARLTLEKTWQGGDGPWLRQASFSAEHAEKKNLLGAMIITLVPGGDPSNADSYRWQEPPPCDGHERVVGQPHLTWIFVAPLWKAGGIGSALLGKSVTALHMLGYRNLWTTFMLGNDASILWHWRNGFALTPFPFSRRVMRQELK